ncbi:winged helix-turn-helix domain-containing protein [Klugiella xanthotipulae]|uniref:Winged helix-turn-helix protein n=1 Tax=Klugiella xanthotipulae TaxID=244735 RepID=A0A543I4B0_9MICO|nr:crosslink repair DNA glycosylase YcaQ family protein [Klugiella xanthotipulae]TQM65428.1 hypothetical protein FB466_0230 [Klugiella xanthotipulae]
MPESLSLGQARRLALGAQNLHRPQPELTTRRRVRSLLTGLGVMQIDSVNVFERSHYLPAFSRHGGYDTGLLDSTLFTSGEYVEYWAHEAAFIHRELWPMFRWRMAERRDAGAATGGWAAEHADTIDWVRRELAERGPSLVREIEGDVRRTRGEWWDWSEVKRAVECLFGWGEVTTLGRERFERRYALTEQVLSPEIVGRRVPEPDAHRHLIETGARAHGVGTLHDFADYFRQPLAAARRAVAELQEEGVLVPVTVEGWTTSSGSPLPAWRHRDAVIPRSAGASALLSPFDPVVWFRPRIERLFNFHYRIEIYTPEAKRVYGYYSLPVLLGDRLVGRVDLKNDRKAGILRVQSAWQEEGAPADTAERVWQLLERAAEWRGCSGITVSGRGNLPLAEHM